MSELAAGPDDPAGDLTAVGDQQLLEHSDLFLDPGLALPQRGLPRLSIVAPARATEMRRAERAAFRMDSARLTFRMRLDSGQRAMLQQEVGAGVLGHRPGEVVALRLVTAFGQQEAVLAGFLHALRQHPFAEGQGQTDDRADDCGVGRRRGPSSRTNDLSILILWTGRRFR